MTDSRPFWERKALEDMTPTEWESLCDGCAKCCLHKLEDEDTGEVHVTNVACRLLDIATCRCTNYAERKRLVPDCVIVRPETLDEVYFMPSTCAYRLLAEGKPLPDWHPLITGDPQSVHKAGISHRGKLVSEREAGDLEDHVMGWTL
ncbi:MAG: YcgN family cysteine cluster protein [Alphaproteobacteria bacterium]|nr:YcgN family cysteine cluster protein [Alphaproteobacteria bacterium]